MQVQWTREDDLQHDHYRPAAWHHFRAGIGGDGRMSAFDHHFVTFGRGGETISGAGLSPNHYPAGLVQNFRLRQSLIECNIPTGPWRSPGHSAYCWAYQSFFDEVALAAGRDQLDFRLDLLSKAYGEPPLDLARTAGTLRLAAEKAGWGKRQLGPGRGMGMAFHFNHGGFVSHVAEVTASGNRIKVDKVYAGVDVGPILNLSGARSQVEGAVVDALSTAQLEITAITAIRANTIRAFASLTMFIGGPCCWRSNAHEITSAFLCPSPYPLPSGPSGARGLW